MRSMKDSGIEWIGDIPTHWNICRIGNIFSLRDERNYKKMDEVTLLSLYAGIGVFPRGEHEERGNKAVTVEGYKIVKKNDIVVNIILSWMGALGISDYNGVTSPAYDVYIPNIQKVIPRFFHYVFRTPQIANECYRYGKGIMLMRLRTYSSEFKRIKVPFPNLLDQQKIADFLDEKCSEIDSLSADIQTQIDTLEEYKRAVINEAVTKGLNPSVEMKDSGIEWQKKIPNTWKLNKVKYISSSSFKGQGIKKDDVDIDGDFPCVRYGEIYSKYSNVIENCVSNILSKNMKKNQPVIKTNDILFAGTGELIEEIGKNVLYSGENICAVGGDIIVYRVRENPFFINYALNSIYCQNQKSCSKLKLKVVHISSFEIGNIKVFLPPLNEQQEIVNYLDRKCSEIEKTISEKQKQLETLEEYKKSLIYECVTGKKEIA